MTRLLLIAALAGLALARPESYKEKEDFQYSRSSSDEGTKSGFYGAQRGNMGGNYERAHHMDTLAQKQMSSAVNQVTGEIGDTSDTNAGSVFTAANTRGVYGQGQYDLSNLQGRNFLESSTFDDNSHSSALNSGYGGHSSLQNSGYSAGHSAFNGHNTRYSGYNTDAETLHRNNLQALEKLSNSEYGRQSGYGSEYRGYSGNQASTYDHQNSNLYAADRQYSTKNRLVGANGAPVRIIIRPGSTVDVPVAAETFEDRQSSVASSHDSVNRDVEVLTNNNRDRVVLRPTGEAKHYESSYKYSKEWEKHDTKPVSIPLAVPTVPQNKELYDDSQRTSGTEFQGNSIAGSGYQTAANSQSHYQANSQYNAQRQHGASYRGYNNAYPVPYTNDDAVVGIGSGNPAPKKFESSYSYHKSWERQGDPYVIQPVQAVPADSQRLTAATNQQGYGSHQYGSQYKKSHQSYTKSGALIDCDCDDDTHSRVVRSVDSLNQRQHEHNPYLQNYQKQEELTQELQNENYGNLRSHLDWSKNSELEDLGQQTEDQWKQFGRATQRKAEDLGQQTQDAWGNLELENSGESVKHLTDAMMHFEHVKPVWEQSEDYSHHTLVHAVDTTQNGPYFSQTVKNIDFPNHSKVIGQLPNHQQTFAHSIHKESGFESQQHQNSEELMHELTPEEQNYNQSPIQSLWDRIDGLQQTLPSNEDSMDNDKHVHGSEQAEFSSSSMQNWHSDSGLIQNTHHNQNNFRWHYRAQKPSEELLPPADLGATDVTRTTTEKPFVDHSDMSPKHNGRGDIEDDDSTNGETQPSVNKPSSQFYTFGSTQQTKPYKTSAEIEALSLTKENETEIASSLSDTDLGVISLSEQWLNELKNNLSASEKSKNTAISSTNVHSNNQSTQQVNQESYVYDKDNLQPSYERHGKTQKSLESNYKDNIDYTYHGLFDQQNTGDQQFLDLVKEAINNDQQSEMVSFGQDSGDQFVNQGQETMNHHVPGESLSSFDTFSSQSYQQENLGQETVSLHIPDESFSFFDKNNQHKIEDIGQIAENQNHQNTDLYNKKKIGKESLVVNPSESLSTFSTQNTQSQHQYNDQETEKMKIPNDPTAAFDTQNTDFHKNEYLGQETVNLDLPSDSMSSFYTQNRESHKHGYLSQETQTLENSSDSLKALDKQNLQNENLGQQTVNLHESLNAFDSQGSQQYENLDQQSEVISGFEERNSELASEDHGQQSVDLQQQDKLDSFNKYVYDPSDKSKNLEQSVDDTQYPTDFDARSSLQQPQEDHFYKERNVAQNSELNLKASEHQVDNKSLEAEVVGTVVEVTTVKPGFWKAVGSKFVSAKDKVSSWFKSS